MKLDKIQEKNLKKILKSIVKNKGYKEKSGRIFLVIKDIFIYSCVDVLHHEIIDYTIHIKYYDYDDIFWKIMRMPENIKEPNYLRALGAFKSPSICIKSVQLEISENFEMIAEYIIDDIETSALNFIKQNEVDEYAIKDEEDLYFETLKCIALIHKGDISSAKDYAKENIDKGNCGDFINQGKGFFELLLLSNDRDLL